MQDRALEVDTYLGMRSHTHGSIFPSFELELVLLLNGPILRDLIQSLQGAVF